jgi:hypothetical protein
VHGLLLHGPVRGRAGLVDARLEPRPVGLALDHEVVRRVLERSIALWARSVSSNVVSHPAVSRLLVTTLAAQPVRSTKSW